MYQMITSQVAPRSLSLTEQSVLLAEFALRNRSQPRDELTREELSPYLSAVLEPGSSQCWSLRSAALLLRSELEGRERRSVERSMMQAQALVDCTRDVEGKQEVR